MNYTKGAQQSHRWYRFKKCLSIDLFFYFKNRFQSGAYRTSSSFSPQRDLLYERLV